MIPSASPLAALAIGLTRPKGLSITQALDHQRKKRNAQDHTDNDRQ
jgi:hypothetical protein